VLGHTKFEAEERDMTQQVSKGYRNHRRATWAIVLGVLVAVGLAIVLPATGATGDPISPTAWPSGVTPTVVNVGGSNFNCSTNTGGQASGMSTFQISNPPQSRTTVTYDSTNTASMSTPLPNGVTFTISGLNGQAKGKYFAFTVSGARVFHVGVKGGSDSAWYNYYSGDPSYPNGVSGDGATLSNDNAHPGDYPYPTSSTGLHATKKDATNLYVASYTTFCYKPVVKIEGNVYEDTNGDGAKNGSESAFATTRTVTLDNGASTTTDSNGNYTFYVAAGGTYTVCVNQNLSSEAQTQPSGSTAPVGSDYCHTDPDVAGYRLTPTADVSNISFGLTAGTTGVCNRQQTSTATGGATYSVTLQGSSCKLGGQQLVFNTWSDSGAHFASLHPTSTGLPACVVSTGANCNIVLEQITWTLDAGSTPKPLKYSDAIPPPPLASWEDMPYCKVNPESGTFTPAQILPQRADSSYHTSCLYKSTQTVKSNGGSTVWYVEKIDNVYSAQDGNRAA
jgi:hypothetical protein